MHWLETKIPPPIVMLVIAVLMWASARHPTDALGAPSALTIIAFILAVLGLGLNIAPKVLFKRRGTTVNPLRPSATTSLIRWGPYRYSRNPMYLGHGLILLAWSAFLHSPVSLVGVPLFIVYVTRFQVLPEERHLTALFNDEYAEFCRKVPRWL